MNNEVTQLRNLMESIDLAEDDYFPPSASDGIDVQQVEAFVNQYVDQYLGAPHRASVSQAGVDGTAPVRIIVSVPASDSNKTPRVKRKNNNQNNNQMMKDEWRETGEEIIDELQRAGLGEFEIYAYNPRYVEIQSS
jgi:hypothetical protein